MEDKQVLQVKDLQAEVVEVIKFSPMFSGFFPESHSDSITFGTTLKF